MGMIPIIRSRATLQQIAEMLEVLNDYSAVERDENCVAVEGLLDESKHFIEGTAAEADVDKAAELVGLQIQLARWQYKWHDIWLDLVRRREVAAQSGRWSDRLLEIFGLLE
jgi:hypothetical protein